MKQIQRLFGAVLAVVLSPHVDGDGVLQRSVPLYDGGLVIRLDEQLRALMGLQLQPAEARGSTLLTL